MRGPLELVAGDAAGRRKSDRNEWHRLLAELLGAFLLVLGAVGGGMVNAKFGVEAIGQAALAPLMHSLSLDPISEHGKAMPEVHGWSRSHA